MKDYLSSENARNKEHAEAYTRLLHRAFGGESGSCAIMIGHHLTFELNGDLKTENEIPSADTMMFDHEIMVKVFGPAWAMNVMTALARTPVTDRDKVLTAALDHLDGHHG